MRKEFEIKIPGSIDSSILFGLGAEPLGQVTQKDIYLAGDETWRIREEAGSYLFTTKSHDVGRKARVKEVDEHFITKEEVDHLIKQRGIRVVAFKTRALYRLADAVITVDRVEHLGDFIEIRSVSEMEAFRILKIIGFDEHQVIKDSYLDMMIEKTLPKLIQIILRLHDKIGAMTFGITSGVLTTSGMLVGISSATSSKIAVLAAILTVAIADSFSDAFGIYMSKASERGSTRQAQIRYTLGTLIGKFLLPLAFAVPIIFLPLGAGVLTGLAWGGAALILLSIESAIVRQENLWLVVFRNLGFAFVIIIFSWAVGSLIGKLA